MRSSRLPAVKTLAEFDFAFQPGIRRVYYGTLASLIECDCDVAYGAFVMRRTAHCCAFAARHMGTLGCRHTPDRTLPSRQRRLRQKVTAAHFDTPSSRQHEENS